MQHSFPFLRHFLLYFKEKAPLQGERRATSGEKKQTVVPRCATLTVQSVSLGYPTREKCKKAAAAAFRLGSTCGAGTRRWLTSTLPSRPASLAVLSLPPPRCPLAPEITPLCLVPGQRERWLTKQATVCHLPFFLPHRSLDREKWTTRGEIG